MAAVQERPQQAQQQAQAQAQVVSLVNDYGEHGSGCGYCGSKRQTSVSHGMMADTLSVGAYQALLDRGWRRSGCWVYFPLQERSCCQLLTIRLDVTRFAPNKEQRRVQRRWAAYLEGAPMPGEQPQAAGEQQQQRQEEAELMQEGAVAGGSPKRAHDELEDAAQWGALSGQRQEQQQAGSGEEGGGKRHRHAADAAAHGSRGASPTAQLSQHLSQVLLPSQPSDSQQKQQQHGPAVASEAQLASQLAAALQQAVAAGLLPAAAYPAPKVQQPTAKLRKLLPPSVAFTSAFPLAVAAAASKAQAAGAAGGGASNGAAGGKLSADAVAAALVQQLPADVAAAAEAAKGHINFSVQQGVDAAAGAAAAASVQPAGKHRQAKQQPGPGAAVAAAAGAAPAPIPRGVPRHFELRTLPSSDPSLVDTEFALFKKYQVVHHGDKPGEVTPRSFKRFLVDTPLVHEGPDQHPPGACPSTGFGSFHQQYWLDGRLVAVGVVDVLPRCLSSKYLFWDTDMAPLSLGKLTSLAEIGWVRGQQASCPALRYYYLGFYIHNCHRMRYKGDFAPSDVLCPKNKCWVPLARVQGALDQPGMIPISELPGALEGLGADHLVDAATGAPLCPPRLPSDEELAGCKLMLHLPTGPHGRKQPHVVSLGQLQRAGMLRTGPQSAQFEATLAKWWSRVGPEAAASTAYAID